MPIGINSGGNLCPGPHKMEFELDRVKHFKNMEFIHKNTERKIYPPEE